MASRKDIVEYLHEFLNVGEFKDYCPNGLQVEGKPEINHIVAGVTASQALIDSAIEQQADAVLVHHGFFWKGEDETITGIKQKRIKALLAADINLLAYHLPLDAHPEVGNNVQLASQLDIQVAGTECINGTKDIFWRGEFEQSLSADELKSRLVWALGREALCIESLSNQRISTIGWCSGGAQSYIQMAADLNLDAYLSGEVSEQTFHQAKELDIHYFAAGHHATERYGVQALAAHLKDKFDISYQYVEIDNPV